MLNSILFIRRAKYNIGMKKIFYRVLSTDTLFGVAEKFGVCFSDIVSDNNLTREISAGDILIINKDDCTLYSVKPFDTVKSIAKAFGVTEESILLKNSAIPYVFYGLKIKI